MRPCGADALVRAEACSIRKLRKNFETERRRTGVAAVHLLAFLALALAGCSQHKVAQEPLPAPPPPAIDTKTPATASSGQVPTSNNQVQSEDEKLQHFPLDAKPLMVETGLASWYGPPYHNRRGSNGKIYDMNAMTAAHRTLPLGSIVRVTNVKTGNSAIVRITDRGPFITGRILDLSLAAAKKIDLVRAGVAQVRIEVLEAPVAIASGGRWAVQIGGFDQQESASKLADQITRRYRAARVSSFNSPVGDWWVRVRVQNDDRSRAQEIARDTHTDQGAVFLVRLD